MAEIAVVGCILAGGRSRRMARDKRFEPLGGKPLIAHAIDRLRPQVDRLMINASGEAERLQAYGLPVRGDPIPDFAGPLAGILAGLSWAAEMDADALVTAPCDSPFLPDDLVARLSAVTYFQIVCAASGGRVHPVFGLWREPSQYLASLEQALRAGEHKVESFISRYKRGFAEWPIDKGDPYFNINTPAEFSEAERILAEGVP